MIELNYELTDKDLDNFNLESLTIKSVFLTIHKINLILFGIGSFVWSLQRLICGSFIISFIVAILCSIVLTILLHIIIARYAMKQKLKGIDRNSKAVINDNDITSENSIGKVTYNWTAVKGIYNKKHNILIFLGPVQAMIIPKRIFNSKEELDEFWTYIQGCHNNSR